jgi:hypothetical protein
MNPTNMLELQKLVLENVCENKIIFEKELRKSFKWLDKNDLNKLYKWAIRKFNGGYHNIINCVYSSFDIKITNQANANSFANDSIMG